MSVGPGHRQLEKDSACTRPDPASSGVRSGLKGGVSGRAEKAREG